MKKSYGNCEACPLVEQTRVRGDTNVTIIDRLPNFEEIEILIFAESPASAEIEANIPLIGRAGKVFRKAFEESKLNTFKYYISNVVLCSNIDETGKTHNPPIEAYNCCKPNWEKLIDSCPNLKLIFIMGKTALDIFKINQSTITQARGNFYKYKGHDILVTFHPSYILRNGGIESGKGKIFSSDFDKAYDFLNSNNNKDLGDLSKVKKNEPYSFKLPEWCYSDEYALFDIQPLYRQRQILYIFNHKNGEKKYYTISMDKNYFYTSNTLKESELHLRNHEELELVLNKPKENYEKFEKGLFEADVKPVLKHAIDYRYNRKIDEPDIPLRIQFMDIEIYNEGSRAFPKPRLAEKPINSISFKNNEEDVTWVYLLHHKKMDKTKIDENIVNSYVEEDSNIRCKVFRSERQLLIGYSQAIKDYDPHIITGWNADGFDYPYIYHRMKNLKMKPEILSPIDEAMFIYTDDENDRDFKFLYGCHLADMMKMYKEYTYSIEESYKLDAICKKHLGGGKVAYEGTLDVLYETDINKFIAYSGIDTFRLFELDNKLKHIELAYETIKICSSTWEASKTTTGLIDPLVISFAKEEGLICKNSAKSEKTEKFKGAFVRSPKSGVHDYVIDLDYTSLYPSIITTYNIDTLTYLGKIEPELAKQYIYFKDKLPEDITMILNPLTDKKDMVYTKKEFDKFIEENEAIVCINGTIFYGHDKKPSFLSSIIEFVKGSRIHYQGIIKNAKAGSIELKVADNRQAVYKVIMNSIYGVLGSAHFRLFVIDLAEAITLSGQEVSRFAQYHTGHYWKRDYKGIENNFDQLCDIEDIPYIIYGDTDSVFLAVGDYMKDKGIYTYIENGN